MGFLEETREILGAVERTELGDERAATKIGKGGSIGNSGKA